MFQHTPAFPITPSIIPHLLHHILTSFIPQTSLPPHPHLLHHTLTSNTPSPPPSYPYLLHHTLTSSIIPSPHPSHPHLLHHTLPRPSHPHLHLHHHTFTSSIAPSPPDPPPSRGEPMESISSMNMIEGACSLAMTNSSLTMRDPSPMYFCTSSELDTLIKVHSVWCATALAKKGFAYPRWAK